MFIPKHIGIQEIEEDKRPGGEMIQSNISNYGTELLKIEISGKTWGRPISNKGLLKAEIIQAIYIVEKVANYKSKLNLISIYY